MRERTEPIAIPSQNADLRAFVRKKKGKVWLKTIAWELFWGSVFWYYGTREDMTFDYRFSLALSALLLVGLFLFGWVQMMLDRSFRGVVVDITTKQVLMTDPTMRRRSLSQQLLISIEEESGTRHKIVLPFKKHYDRYYHKGDRITYYSGLKYPESCDGAERDIYVCSRCGGVETSDTDHCHGCGFSLIKPYRSRYDKNEKRRS